MKICPHCSNEFAPRALELFGKTIFEAKYCDACGEVLSARFEREQREKALKELEDRNAARWARLCPPLYRDTDILRLPQEALLCVLAWPYGPRGLILGGKTGSFKTRIMFALVRRYFDEGHSIRVYTPSTFRTAITTAATDGTYEDWLKRASEVDVFFFDDLGQMKLTESSEEALLAVFEGRAAQMKPIFATTQYRGSEFVAQFLREHRGTAVLRRMEEFCETIAL